MTTNAAHPAITKNVDSAGNRDFNRPIIGSFCNGDPRWQQLGCPRLQMSTVHFENWDGVTAAAITSGWNVQSGLITTTTEPTLSSKRPVRCLKGNCRGMDVVEAGGRPVFRTYAWNRDGSDRGCLVAWVGSDVCLLNTRATMVVARSVERRADCKEKSLSPASTENTGIRSNNLAERV